MKSIEITEVVAHATAGAMIGCCIKEALILAVTEWRNVRFCHNGKDYRIIVNRLFGTVEGMKPETKGDLE